MPARRITKRHLLSDLKLILSAKLTKVILSLSLLFLLTPFFALITLDTKPAKEIEYGVTFSQPYAEYLGLNWKEVYLAILDDLRVDNIRLVAYWNRVEPKEGKYDFSELDFMIEEARKRDVRVILAVGNKVPRWPECHYPGWVEGLSDGEFKSRLLSYIEETANRYRHTGAVSIWQVENEPFFPFGFCRFLDHSFVETEIGVVRANSLGEPVVIQDSGEGGFWFPTYSLGDYLGISMYRRIWFDFWGLLLGKHVFFTYPLAYWSYPLKAKVVGVPLEKIKVLELQAEPWGDAPITVLSQEKKDKTMSRDKFLETISYAQKTGIGSLYFWGVEWWYWEKEMRNEPFFWETAKAFWK